MVDGFLIIDKPAGITSHDVVNRVRRTLGIKKVGHTGTLDPFATGVLPIATGEATKAIQFLDEGEKEYQAVIRLGITTDTLDITGNVLEGKDSNGITEDLILEQISRLTGKIKQLPPMYSAIKQAGQPLYKLARKGVEAERTLRDTTIHLFDLIDFESPFATVRVRCSRGTYIRTLADDLGRMLGCGACLTELRRIRSGIFNIRESITLEQLAEFTEKDTVTQHIVSLTTAISHIPEISLNSIEHKRLKNGIPPHQSLSVKPEGLYRLMHDGKLAAVAEQLSDASVTLKRVFN